MTLLKKILKRKRIIAQSLSINYNIQWKECPCMKGVRLEDVTPELEEKALNEIKNNN